MFVKYPESSHTHPLLVSSCCGLADIHTIKTPEISALIYVLSTTFPALLKSLASQPSAKPVKLLVIDTLAELFHSHGKTSATSLRERSKNLAELSTLLHTISSRYRIAVLVLNEVADVFDMSADADPGNATELVYRDQARWFNRADSIPGEDRKEASLGLVWANQVNVRIMLSRTARLRRLDGPDHRKAKRRRLDGYPHSPTGEQLARIRRLSVIFSSVARPASLDYIITEEGFSTIPEDDIPPDPPVVPAPAELPLSSSSSLGRDGAHDLSPLDLAAIETEDGPLGDEDEWDEYWKLADVEELTQERGDLTI
ncbi:hypothetical protein OBBRIDRAFT_809784 [Obba rivulosa]|uniref:RecA family profile 1 domain-containing protein n=1 Tax=Obba rivulosa TaxID=1052685 RepID=A0A8E2DTQ3_9APHY|nr:hypothetical protein OBBRIDRAFT_809784 [Obba rivulosa]